jgi:hypothetical protein
MRQPFGMIKSTMMTPAHPAAAWAGDAATEPTEVQVPMTGLLDTIKEKTGIYGLGFDPTSVFGILFPIILVLLIAGIGLLINVVFLS